MPTLLLVILRRYVWFTKTWTHRPATSLLLREASEASAWDTFMILSCCCRAESISLKSSGAEGCMFWTLSKRHKHRTVTVERGLIIDSTSDSFSETATWTWPGDSWCAQPDGTVPPAPLDLVAPLGQTLCSALGWEPFVVWTAAHGTERLHVKQWRAGI